MYHLSNNNKTAIVLLHEIYGINDNIIDKAKQLHHEGFDVYCPNLLGSDIVYDYKDDEEAYSNFYTNVGYDLAVKNVEVLIRSLDSIYKSVFVIGYSIGGASIAWIISGKVKLDGVVCFYGSRIRDYAQMEPINDCALFFASDEKKALMWPV